MARKKSFDCQPQIIVGASWITIARQEVMKNIFIVVTRIWIILLSASAELFKCRMNIRSEHQSMFEQEKKVCKGVILIVCIV